MCEEARDSGSGFRSAAGDPWTRATVMYLKKEKKIYTHMEQLLVDQISQNCRQ